MITYSTTEARSNLSDIVNQVKYKQVIIAIWRNNKAEVFMTPVPTEYDIPITEINSDSKSFNFLNDEPELYSINDLKVKYV